MVRFQSMSAGWGREVLVERSSAPRTDCWSRSAIRSSTSLTTLSTTVRAVALAS